MYVCECSIVLSKSQDVQSFLHFGSSSHFISMSSLDFGGDPISRSPFLKARPKVHLGERNLRFSKKTVNDWIVWLDRLTALLLRSYNGLLLHGSWGVEYHDLSRRNPGDLNAHLPLSYAADTAVWSMLKLPLGILHRTGVKILGSQVVCPVISQKS